MIPAPGHPTQEQASRAISQADEFVRRTRAEAQAQIARQHQIYTGGQQPGVLTYGGHAAAMTAGAAMRAGQGVIAGGATMMGAGAAMTQPMSQQVMMAAAGARPGQMPQGLMGLLTTAYAPRWLLPHAGRAFGMERAVRQEFAGEELGRRWDMFGRRAATTAADLMSFGVTSHLMRRTGVEARLFTQMQTERTMQSQLGVLRGMGGMAGATGFGVRRGFLTEGAGREAMDEIMGGAGQLQAQFGYSGEQLNQLTQQAAGAIDPSRVRRMGGSPGGMRQLGREVREIRDTLAQTARELQLTEEELPRFFEQLKSTMQITGSGFRAFREETRAVGLRGPFTQRQAAQMGMEYTQMGRGQYLDPTSFRGEAFSRALEVADLRERGVINRNTLLREGGGLDQAAMQRMLMQRLQIQSQAVQGGQFNQAMVLAGAAPQAYGAMMQGADFFQTQGAVGAAMMQDPFALLRARLNPQTRQRVTMDAQLIAFRQSQQMMPFLPGGRAQAIQMFGQRFGMAPEQAQPWYEEQEQQLGGAERILGQRGVAEGDPARRRALATFAVGFGRRTGTSVRDIGIAMGALGTGLGETPVEMEENVTRFRDQMVQKNVENVMTRFMKPYAGHRGAFSTVGGSENLQRIISSGAGPALMKEDPTSAVGGVLMASDPGHFGRTVRSMRAKGLSEDLISRALLGAAAQPQYARIVSKDPLDVIARGLARGARFLGFDAQASTRGVMAERTWVELQGDKQQLMRQQWTPTSEAERVEIALLGEGVELPEKYQRRKEGWDAPEAYEDRYELAERTRVAKRDPITVAMLGRARRFKELRGGPSLGMLREITGSEMRMDEYDKLLDLDKNKEIFSRIEDQTALAPIARVIRGGTARGDVEDYEELRTALPLKQMQRLTRQFAAEKGWDVRVDYAKDADKFEKFMGDLGGPQRKEFSLQMRDLAIMQSDRLARATVPGSGPGSAMWIQWKGMGEPGNETPAKPVGNG